LDVRSFDLEPGRIVHLSTYGHEVPDPARISEFPCGAVDEACSFILEGGVFAGFSHPVAAVAAVAEGEGFALAARNILVRG
jgi:IMP cyclohydrolase